MPIHIQAQDEMAGLQTYWARGRPRAPAREGSPSRRGTGFRAMRGFRSAPRRPRNSTRSVRFPVAWIEEVMADGAQADLGDERHQPLVVRATHALAKVVHERGREPCGDELRRTCRRSTR